MEGIEKKLIDVITDRKDPHFEPYAWASMA